MSRVKRELRVKVLVDKLVRLVKLVWLVLPPSASVLLLKILVLRIQQMLLALAQVVIAAMNRCIVMRRRWSAVQMFVCLLVMVKFRLVLLAELIRRLTSALASMLPRVLMRPQVAQKVDMDSVVLLSKQLLLMLVMLAIVRVRRVCRVLCLDRVACLVCRAVVEMLAPQDCKDKAEMLECLVLKAKVVLARPVCPVFPVKAA